MRGMFDWNSVDSLSMWKVVLQKNVNISEKMAYMDDCGIGLSKLNPMDCGFQKYDFEPETTLVHDILDQNCDFR